MQMLLLMIATDVRAIFETPLRPGASLDALARYLCTHQNEEGR